MPSTILKLYDGEVELHYLELAKKHRYLVNGKEKKGVTSVLQALNKPALMLWPLREALEHIHRNMGALYMEDELDYEAMETLLNEAATAYQRKGDKGKDIGTEVHNAAEKFLKGEEYEVTGDEAIKAFTAFKLWFEEINPKILAVEEIVYSRTLDYCGKFDCLLEIDGKTILCDLKTTNSSQTAPLGIYPENFLQLGAYAHAYEEEKGVESITDLMVINCSKRGKVSTLKASDIGLAKGQCTKGFVNTLEVFRFMDDAGFKVKNYTETT